MFVNAGNNNRKLKKYLRNEMGIHGMVKCDVNKLQYLDYLLTQLDLGSVIEFLPHQKLAKL